MAIEKIKKALSYNDYFHARCDVPDYFFTQPRGNDDDASSANRPPHWQSQLLKYFLEIPPRNAPAWRNSIKARESAQVIRG
jgi:hypothetical protein